MTTVDLCGEWPLVLPEWRQEHWAQNPQWEEAHLASMAANLHPGDVVFDVGAELGDFTALFASWGCLPVPVEPAPWYWPAIREMFDVNGLEKPVGAFAGFCHSETSYDPDHSPRKPWPREARGPYSGFQGFQNVTECPTASRISVDDLARIVRPPRGITVDVEGAEYQVVKGALRTLRLHRPLLWLSVHEECMVRDWGVTWGQLQSIVESYDYRTVLLERGGEDHYFCWPAEVQVVR